MADQWLCDKCRTKLNEFKAWIDYIQAIKRDEHGNADRILIDEIISTGGNKDAKSLLAMLRECKSRDWKNPYCVICLRLAIMLKRTLTTNPYQGVQEEERGFIRWSMEINPSRPQIPNHFDFWSKVEFTYVNKSTDRWKFLGRLRTDNQGDLPDVLDPLQHDDRNDVIRSILPEEAEECLWKPIRGNSVRQLGRTNEAAEREEEERLKRWVSWSNLQRRIRHTHEPRAEYAFEPQDEGPFHFTCQRSYDTKTTWSPKRLLEIDILGEYVKLIKTGVARSEAQFGYVTLSHRWSSEEALSLIRDTEALFEGGIPVASLSKTFRHAIAIAHDLGFRYIWIDHLCILQDDKTDWRTQSAVMGQIYALAALNIAALEAIGADDGLIPIRDPRVVVGVSYRQMEDRLGVQKACSAKDQPEGAELSKALSDFKPLGLRWDDCSMDYWQPSLASRGWVFQEREFARKTLLIHNVGALWVCRSSTHSAWPTVLRGLLGSEREDNPSGCIQTYREVFVQRLRQHKITTDDWLRAIRIYSATGLTYAQDRLIAISSVAARVQSLGRDRYLAGIFEDDIARQLAWESISSYQSEPPNVYLAPSWSWASTNRAVEYRDYERHRPLAHLIDAQIEPVDEKFPFGQIQAGWLKLCGHCYPITITIQSRIIFESHGVSMEFCPDTQSGYCCITASPDGRCYALNTITGRSVWLSDPSVNGISAIWTPQDDILLSRAQTKDLPEEMQEQWVKKEEQQKRTQALRNYMAADHAYKMALLDRAGGPSKLGDVSPTASSPSDPGTESESTDDAIIEDSCSNIQTPDCSEASETPQSSIMPRTKPTLFAIPILLGLPRILNGKLRYTCLVVERNASSQTYRRLGLCVYEPSFEHEAYCQSFWQSVMRVSDQFYSKHVPTKESVARSEDFWNSISLELTRRRPEMETLIIV